MRRLKKVISLFLILLYAVAFSFFGFGCKDEAINRATNTTPTTTSDVEGKTAQKENEQQDKKYGDVKGFLWQIKKGNSVVYMYGSIHVGDKDIYPLCKNVEEAFDSSNVLVGEIDITDTKALTAQAMKMIYSNGDTAYDHMSSEGKKKVEEACKELDFNPRVVLNQKVWSLGSIISGYQMKKAGYDANYGIDMYFMNKAKGKKKIMEVEGAEFQFNLLNSFSDEEQEKYFISSMSTIEDTKQGLDKIFQVFKSGDEEEMEKVLGEDDRNSNFYEKMILERNKSMASKIEEYLKTGDSYFVVVGLAHYLGEDGVIKLLQDKGYTVTKI